MRTPRSRRGNVAVIVALSCVVLLGFAAITLDLGYARLVRQQLENTSEAAAHAGSLKLDGTSAGMTAARAAAAEIAVENLAAGRAIDLDANTGNLSTGDIVLGSFDADSRTFTPSSDPTVVDTVQVRARVPDLALFTAPVSLGISTTPVSALSRVQSVHGGASAVSCYLPLGVASCMLDRYTVAGLTDITLKINPAGIDNVGWARANGTPNANWTRDQINGCTQDGEAAVGDPVGLQNGVVTTAMAALATAVSTSSTTWRTATWGAQPARLANSSIPAAKYGHTLEAPMLVFDGGSAYCSGSGGPFNQSRPLVGFVWASVYDVVNNGSAASRTIRLRVDTRNDYNYGTGAGGPDYGVVANSPPRRVQ